jgi:hypothetical protein
LQNSRDHSNDHVRRRFRPIFSAPEARKTVAHVETVGLVIIKVQAPAGATERKYGSSFDIGLQLTHTLVYAKRQRAGVVQDASRIFEIIVPRAASWTAAALRRFFGVTVTTNVNWK